jgi:hypothetical protein
LSTIANAIRDSREVHFLVVLDFEGLIKRFATTTLTIPASTVDDLSFEGVILNRITVGSSFDLRSFNYSSQRVGIEIANKMRLQDLECTRRMRNGTGKIYVWSPGLTWEDIETNGLLFTGIFQPEKYDLLKYSFSLIDVYESTWVDVPSRILFDDAWPNARGTFAGAGSVLGKSEQIVFGAWSKGIPLQCVDATNFKYLATAGVSLSVDADYTAGTVDVYDSAGAVIDPAGYTYTPGVLDGLGNIVSLFDFTADQVASEPLTCSIQGIEQSATLLEHPADIVTYMLRTYARLLDSQIHHESIKTLKTLFPELKFSVILNSPGSLRDIIDRILSQCLAGRISIQGKIGVVTLATNVPDIAKLNWKYHLIGGTASVTRTSYDEIYNKIITNYALNPSTGKYEAEFVKDASNSLLCKHSEADYGRRNEIVLSYPDVQGEGDARLLTDRFIEFKSQQHEIIEVSVPFWDGFDIQEGDAALISIREGSSLTASGWTDEKCILIERMLGEQTIQQKWWRIGT